MSIKQDNEILASDIKQLVNYYGTCDTTSGIAAKVVTLSLSNSFELIKGATIIIKFTYANTVANPTLNVDNTGAKAIYWHGAALASSQYWQAGAVLQFVYNETQWELVGISKDNNTTYSSLPNPSAININVDGTQILTYDGSAGQNLNFWTGDNITLSGTTGAITINSNASGDVLVYGTYVGNGDNASYQTISPGLAQIKAVYVYPAIYNDDDTTIWDTATYINLGAPNMTSYSSTYPRVDIEYNAGMATYDTDFIITGTDENEEEIITLRGIRVYDTYFRVYSEEDAYHYPLNSKWTDTMTRTNFNQQDATYAWIAIGTL